MINNHDPLSSRFNILLSLDINILRTCKKDSFNCGQKCFSEPTDSCHRWQVCIF